MTTSKRLAWMQLLLIAVSLIATIAMIVSVVTWEWTEKEPIEPVLFAGTWWLLSFGFSIATFIVGIIQCVYAGQTLDGSGKAMAAGILGILAMIPLVVIASLVLNILVVADVTL